MGVIYQLSAPLLDWSHVKNTITLKIFFSVVLMGTVDSKYRFVWASCGYPKIGKKVGSLLVPPLILGDAAFPLQPWLMKPCTNANPTPQQRYYNYRLSRARMVTEVAFGQLKGR